MRKTKYYLSLIANEYRLMLHCLFDLRNKLIADGRYTDAVDDIIIKCIK